MFIDFLFSPFPLDVEIKDYGKVVEAIYSIFVCLRPDLLIPDGFEELFGGFRIIPEIGRFG